MTLGPGFPSASAVSSAKPSSLVPSPSLRNCGLTASTFMYQVPGREVFQFLERNKHRWHVVRDRSWIIGYLISNQTAGTLAVILNNRRVTVRSCLPRARRGGGLHPRRLDLAPLSDPTGNGHTLPGIVHEFGKHTGVVNVRGPEWPIALHCPLLGTQLLVRSFCVLCLNAEKISQTAMNIAAITGPRTRPSRPKIAIPPSVEISTT